MAKFIVIGLGVFGRQVALTLAEEGAEVIAVDTNMERVDEIHDYVAYSVKLDAREISSLRSLGLQDMDAGVVAIGEDFEANLLAAANLKEVGVEKVISRAANPIHRKILEQIGAHEIISPEDEIGRKTAYRLLKPNVIDYLDVAGEFELIRMETPDEFVGKTLAELDLRREYQVNVIGINKIQEPADEEGDESGTEVTVTAVPDTDTKLEENTILVLLGKEEHIDNFTKTFR
jgi:trk system potassium uptake protein TrkA